MATGNPDVEKIAVTKQEREQMAASLAEASWLKLPVRVLDYLVPCVFCHSTWIAVVILWWGGGEFWRVTLHTGIVYGVMCRFVGGVGRNNRQHNAEMGVHRKTCAG